MSFEVYVTTFRNGDFASMTRDQLRTPFAEHLTELEPDLWQVRYDDINWCDIYLTADSADTAMVQGFSVRRPCGDQRLWDSLASILASTDAVLYFPGGRAPVVGRRTVRQHLPPDLIDSLGEPIVVTSGTEILAELHAA